MNVITGERYKMVINEVRNYVKGLYGKPPAPINPDLKNKILGKEDPITCRPADLLEPELEKSFKKISSFMTKEEDVLTYVLFPQVAMKFLQDKKHQVV